MKEEMNRRCPTQHLNTSGAWEFWGKRAEESEKKKSNTKVLKK